MQLSRYTPTAEIGDNASQVKQEQERPEGSVAISTSQGTGTYTMMNIDTGAGLRAVPVETGAASKASDEKRKRNAGASARFRERRKKREMEASVTIRKLERQVKDLSEDMNFYRRERDYFSTVLSSQPGAERHFPRPQSPRIQRPAALPIHASELRSFDYDDDRSLTPEDVPGRPGDIIRQPRDPRFERLHGSGPRSPIPGPPLARSWPTPIQQQQQQQQQQHQDPSVAYRGTPLDISAHRIPPMTERADYRGAGPSHPSTSQFHAPPPPVMQAAPTTGPLDPYRSYQYNRGHNDPGHFGLPRRDQR